MVSKSAIIVVGGAIVVGGIVYWALSQPPAQPTPPPINPNLVTISFSVLGPAGTVCTITDASTNQNYTFGPGENQMIQVQNGTTLFFHAIPANGFKLSDWGFADVSGQATYGDAPTIGWKVNGNTQAIAFFMPA